MSACHSLTGFLDAMYTSALDIFKLGIGPSSSHTVGPMRAGHIFIRDLAEALDQVASVRVDLFGSLALTGLGHATDRAVILGLSGYEPATIPSEAIEGVERTVRHERKITLGQRHTVPFDPATHLVFRMNEVLPAHPNALTLTAFDRDGAQMRQRTFYSTGGGFITETPDERLARERPTPPLDFATGDELLAICSVEGLSIQEVARRNERAWYDEATLDAGLDAIWEAMDASITRGLSQTGTLPGGLKVRRRARDVYRRLQARTLRNDNPPHTCMTWVNVYALAVNEENAAGGRVVTAPTNGAAGIIPAVIRYYLDFVPGADREGVHTLLLAATAVGSIIKHNASISGAEVGCQGEVGSACAMAAAGLAAAMGGSAMQVENAAEIGLEHNLGLTCDPIGGLVQIPCIERNAIAANKAINAAQLALEGDGAHHVSLDQVVKTMRETGADMLTKYKETSQGGLAVNVIEC